MVIPIFDAHFHVIDPRFPLVPNLGYLPPAYTAEEHLRATRPLGVTGGAVVSGSFQAFDQSYLLDALARLGPAYVGVTQLPATTTDAEVLALDRAGVRAVRFNLFRGGSAGPADLDALAARVWELARWHIEIYLDAQALPELAARLAVLPRVVIDHLGMSQAGLPHLLRLVERGVMVKATGFGRVALDVPAALAAIAAVNPGALMFGTDLPSTRAPRPFDPADIALIAETLGERDAQRALHGNAAALYRPMAGPARHD